MWPRSSIADAANSGRFGLSAARIPDLGNPPASIATLQSSVLLDGKDPIEWRLYSSGS